MIFLFQKPRKIVNKLVVVTAALGGDFEFIKAIFLRARRAFQQFLSNSLLPSVIFWPSLTHFSLLSRFRPTKSTLDTSKSNSRPVHLISRAQAPYYVHVPYTTNTINKQRARRVRAYAFLRWVYISKEMFPNGFEKKGIKRLLVLCPVHHRTRKPVETILNRTLPSIFLNHTLRAWPRVKLWFRLESNPASQRPCLAGG